MTACLYISPPVDPAYPENGVIPVIFADSVATLSIRPDKSGPDTPANIVRKDHPIQSSTRLVRKLNIIGRAAFALAGDGRFIQDFIYEAKIQIDDWSQDDRPMRKVAELINNYRMKGHDISLIGAYLPPDTSKGINLVTPVPRPRFHHLGESQAIGSGRAALMDMCRDWEQELASTTNHPDVMSKIASFAGSVSGRRLAEEMAGRADESWGGYVEWCFFNGNKWVRGPSSIHFFYTFTPVSENTFSYNRVHFTAAYDAGDELGRILSTVVRNGVISGREYILESIVDRDAVENLLPSYDFWDAFQPESATITVLVGQVDGANLYINHSVPTPNMKFVHMSGASENHISNVDIAYTNLVFSGIAQRLGINLQMR